MTRRDLAPGSILQRLYLAERVRRWPRPPGRFVEFGAGDGFVSRELLERGWTGRGYDLNADACAENATTNAAFVADGRYGVVHGDFLEKGGDDDADLVVSCMVLEHLDPADVERFFHVARGGLVAGGTLLLMVPGSKRHWGIEDEVAGHRVRFEQPELRGLVEDNGFRVRHIAGLTYPLSNILLPISNRLVRRVERGRLALSHYERTVASGHRSVPFKTSFPRVLGLVLNGATMLPFHLLQKVFRRHPSALILYVEAEPA